MDLAVAAKGDSQEICFVPNGDYAAFMSAYLKEKGVAEEETAGEIVTTDGRTLGRHEGVHRFTVGQRKGLGVATGEPLYVISTNPANHQVVVGGNDDLLRGSFIGQGRELDLDRGRRPRRAGAGAGEDPQSPRRGGGHAGGDRRARSRGSHLRRSAARRHAGTGRGLLRWRLGPRRRLDRIAAFPPHLEGFPRKIFRPTIPNRRLCMSGMLPVLVYLFAMGLPLYLLYHFHSQAWYWHSLAVAAAVCLGLIPIPSQLQNPVCDLIFGFMFIALVLWGVCGLLLFHTHNEKADHKHA